MLMYVGSEKPSLGDSIVSLYFTLLYSTKIKNKCV